MRTPDDYACLKRSTPRYVIEGRMAESESVPRAQRVRQLLERFRRTPKVYCLGCAAGFPADLDPHPFVGGLCPDCQRALEETGRHA